ncbi:MAG: hypothetical protein ACI9ES_000710 [Oceanospirillaceae bacterium]|jgi:hypothetical protein
MRQPNRTVDTKPLFMGTTVLAGQQGLNQSRPKVESACPFLDIERSYHVL